MAYVVPDDRCGRALDCDLIMKGGVTSGLVYPGAITSLAWQYRLRSIGGTSAGAIAAVAAAAMEYGLQTRSKADLDANDPRIVLANMPTRILAQRTERGSTRLEAMFSGDPGTAPMLGVIKAVLAGNGPDLWSVLHYAWTSGLPGTRRAVVNNAAATSIQGLAGGALAGLIGQLVFANVAITAAAALLGTLGTVASAWRRNWRGLSIAALLRDDANRVLGAVVDNGLGLSTANSGPADRIAGEPVKALTPWLHQTIQDLAGLSADKPEDVLTFGKLWSLGRVKKPSSSDPRAIDLVLVCSDLNRMQSGSFPFLPDNHRLFFDPVEWRRLFPNVVVDAVSAKGQDILGFDPAALKMDYTAEDVLQAVAPHGELASRLKLLPMGRDIPILIAARASMAFPGLFTPLPMWLLHFNGEPDQPGQSALLSRIYLSDGGLTSNFPIHLFDAAVPSRPTFAINLLYPGDDLAVEEYERSVPASSEAPKAPPSNVRSFTGEGAAASSGSPNVAPGMDAILKRNLVMPFSNQDQVKFYKPPAGGDALNQLLGLVGRIGETSRCWGDVQLYNQTGARDRIIHIRLTGEEGGFNLNMKPDTITSIDNKGIAAGTVLSCRFQLQGATDPLMPGQPPELDWQNHRKLRINSLLAAQDLLAARFNAGFQPSQPPNPQRDVPPPHSLVVAGHLKSVATALFKLGTPLGPGPDPYADVTKPINLLRIRPADADPRSVLRPF
jgi:predicted acylesterase/phospholipase RssA